MNCHRNHAFWCLYLNEEYVRTMESCLHYFTRITKHSNLQFSSLNWQTTKCMVTVSIYYCLVNTVSMKSLSPKFSDQWSPINQEGKKQYDRDFLMLLQNDPLSKERPPNLPHLDIVKDKSISGGIPSKDWIPTPSFVKPIISRVILLNLFNLVK